MMMIMTVTMMMTLVEMIEVMMMMHCHGIHNLDVPMVADIPYVPRPQLLDLFVVLTGGNIASQMCLIPRQIKRKLRWLTLHPGCGKHLNHPVVLHNFMTKHDSCL